MAYKDEYEVARLYTDGVIPQSGASRSSTATISVFEFHLAPPLLARRDKTTGLPRKMNFGPWLLPAFRLLAKLKGLRGTAFDPFGRSVERRTERKLIGDYEAMLEEVLASSRPRTITSRSASPPSRKKFAASVTSSSDISLPPRLTKRPCSNNFAPVRRRFSKPPNSPVGQTIAARPASTIRGRLCIDIIAGFECMSLREGVVDLIE